MNLSNCLKEEGDAADVLVFSQTFSSNEMILLMLLENSCVSLWVQFSALKSLRE